MGIFSKKNKGQNFFEDLEESVGKNGDDADCPIAPNALTTDEILSNFGGENIASSGGTTDPLGEMRKRMVENAKKREKDIDAPQSVSPSSAKAEPPEESPISDLPMPAGDDFTPMLQMIDSMTGGMAAPEDASKKEVLPPANPSTDVARTVLPPKAVEEQANEPKPKTLLKRCMPYITDENGKDVSIDEKPLYELESVADILRSESAHTLEKLSQKYDISVDFESTLKDLSEQHGVSESVEMAQPTAPIYEEEAVLTPADLPNVSDIDTAVLARPDEAEKKFETGTIRFTPIKRADGNTDHISVSTMTRAIDLTGEIGEVAMTEAENASLPSLEKSEFEEFKDTEETENAKTLLRKTAVLKRNAFLQMIGSLFLFLLSLVFFLPGLHNALITAPKKPMMYLTVLLGLMTLINVDVFTAFKSVFKRRMSTDCFAGTVAVAGLLLGVFAYRQNTNTNQIYAVLCSVALAILLRSIGKFMKSSALLGGARVIAAKKEKKAVALLDDPVTTFAMANNAVEGNALIAVPRPAKNISDYMKYSEFSTVFGKRLRIIFWIATALALIVGFASSAEFHGNIHGIYAATALLCIAATPVLFFLDTLPTYHASVRLNKKGAMIAGKTAAECLNSSNAVVMSSRELFPDGTVTLQDMRILGDNNIDEILVRAAALTETAGSPFAALFREIANTNTDYKLPDSDTVKYEDRLGLSGWVDDELLFIGNRTLMEAHGISVPEVEVDRKILAGGFFPVYIACKDRACALLTVQYSADARIAAELRRMTDLGVELLVDSCDPNMTAEMVCDYLGLYEDSVRIMSNSGVHAYRNAVTPVETQSAPAAFLGNPLSIVSIINCAARMKKSNKILTVLYVLCAILGTLMFVYLTFTGSGLPDGKAVLGSITLSGLVSYLIYCIQKP